MALVQRSSLEGSQQARWSPRLPCAGHCLLKIMDQKQATLPTVITPSGRRMCLGNATCIIFQLYTGSHRSNVFLTSYKLSDRDINKRFDKDRTKRLEKNKFKYVDR